MLEALVSEHIALADRHLREAEERVALQRLRATNSVGHIASGPHLDGGRWYRINYARKEEGTAA